MLWSRETHRKGETLFILAELALVEINKLILVERTLIVVEKYDNNNFNWDNAQKETYNSLLCCASQLTGLFQARSVYYYYRRKPRDGPSKQYERHRRNHRANNLLLFSPQLCDSPQLGQVNFLVYFSLLLLNLSQSCFGIDLCLA